MSNIDLTEAVEAAARGFCGDLVPAVTIDDLSAIQRHAVREQALSYVTHALPCIERQVREQVAREIEAEIPHLIACLDLARDNEDALNTGYYIGARSYLREAARIARGDS